MDSYISSAIFSTAYLAPIEYYVSMLKYKNIEIEQYEHFPKQTYRNRCKIATANGVADLSIPVIKDGNKCITKDIRISYTENWQLVHWRTIEAAYNSSPFFEYYRDDFFPFFSKKTEFLIDFNSDLHNLICELIGIKCNYSFSKEYISEFTDKIDLRDSFSPKKESSLNIKPYYQVFNNKFKFINNLSIIDLLFNMGNESILSIINN